MLENNQREDVVVGVGLQLDVSVVARMPMQGQAIN
jgi:hypothetical protein